MMSTDVHMAYLEALLKKPDLALLSGRRISAIVTGSSADNRDDAYSDWDFKIFVETPDMEAFRERYGTKFAISDNDHNPKVFVMVRPFEYLESEFDEALAVTLWICEHAKVLKDDGSSFRRRVAEQRVKFASSLSEQIQRKYLKLRTRRHGIDSMVKRSDVLAAMMLAQDCIKTSLQILHLVHGNPYPYPQWLLRVSRDMYSRQCSAVFGDIEALGFAQKADAIQVCSRNLVGNLIDVMVARGFDRTRLEQWWLNI